MSENNTSFSLDITKKFDTKPNNVFKAWTDPQKLKQWFQANENWTTPVAEMDAREGGKFRLGMQAPDKDMPYVATGIFKEVKVPEKLVFSWSWEGQEGSDTLVSVEFNEKTGSTEMHFRHENFNDAKVKDEHIQGWNECFQQLEKLFL
jgi:uncharacterized protein YndB with AHSA1/START domain